MDLDECHKILNTSYKNNINEIKKKYYQLAKIYHPDRGGNEKDFRSITDAYNTIVKYNNDPDIYKNFIQSKNIKTTNSEKPNKRDFSEYFEDDNLDDLFINLFESQKFIQKTKEALKHMKKDIPYRSKNNKFKLNNINPKIIINKRCTVKIPFIKIIKGDDVIIDLSDKSNNLFDINISISPRIGIFHKKIELIRNNKKILLNASINIIPLMPEWFGYLGNGNIIIERVISIKNYTRKMRFNLKIPGRDIYNIRCSFPPYIMPIQMIKNGGLPTIDKKTGSLIIYFKCILDTNHTDKSNNNENLWNNLENMNLKYQNSNLKYENSNLENRTNIKEICTLPCNIVSLLNE